MMKRIPSTETFTPAHGAAAVAGVANLQRVRRRLSCTTAAVSRTAAAWSSYVATASSPQGLGSSVRNMTRQLSQHSLKVLNAVSLTTTATTPDEDLSVDLDWRPTLSLPQEILCWGCAAVAMSSLYVLTAPTGFNLVYASCIGLLYGVLVYSLRSSLMEDMYKARERIEADLGDYDSRFRNIDNLRVHVKVKAAKNLPPAAPTAAAAALQPQPPGLKGPIPAIHCYHGFGSNTWSWSLVQQQLADRLGALVTAHDMPGFGLTQRPTDLSGYYLSFNGRLGRLAMDYELAVRGLLSQAEAVKSGEMGYPHTAVHETQGSAAVRTEGETVQAVEAESGGSASQAAAAAADQGLESPLQATAAAAAEGSAAGLAQGAAAAVADATTSSSSSVGSSTQPSAAGAGSTASSSSSSKRVKRVLMGHSLGAACAALEFIQNSDAYSAIILVNPAIISNDKKHHKHEQQQQQEAAAAAAGIRLEQLSDATVFTRTMASGEFHEPEAAAAAAHSQDAAAASSSSTNSSSSISRTSSDLDTMASEQGNITRSSSSSSTAAAAGEVAYYATRGDDESFRSLLFPDSARSKTLVLILYARVLAVLRTFSMLSTLVVLSILRPAIILALRSLVRSRKFWENTLKKAYYDQSKVTPAAVDAYRSPQLVQGWESGMIQFLMARLGSGGARSGSTAAAAASGSAPMGGAEDTGLAHRFAAAVASSNTPVLIVHGAGDILLPKRNSFNLARLVKGCRLAVIKQAGHCPQEEVPELFTDVVAGFLKRHVGVAGV